MVDFSLEGKKIWVAGHTGLVGQALLRRLEYEDCDVMTIPHDQLDLTQQSQTMDWIRENKPNIVIMAAGRVGGILENKVKPAQFFYDNMAMAQNVIHGAYKAKVEKLLYLGSSCIYPKNAAQPIQESSLLSGFLEPTNEAYALAKIAGLKMASYYRDQYGCDFISAMPTNLYGPYDHFDETKSHVIPALIKKIDNARKNNKEKVELWGTGRALRDFLYVDDLADALVLLVRQYSDTKPINIGTGHDISIRELAEHICKIVGYRGEIIFNDEYPDGTLQKLLCSQTINNLGWKPKTELFLGLQETYDWYVKNRA